MILSIIIIVYVLGGILTMAILRAWDMTTGSFTDRTEIVSGGLIWPALWVCFTIIGILWYIYKSMEWLIEGMAQVIYKVVMKIKNKHK